MSDPQYLNEPAAARLLSVHPRTLRRWRRNGAVGHFLTPGGRIRYSLEDLRSLQSRMKISPTLGGVLP